MVERKFYNTPILLLGPLDRLKHRQNVKKELVEMGYQNIIIMESADAHPSEVTLDIKFSSIIRNFEPLVIAFFHKDSRMDGVTFEIGWLCCNYNADELGNKLKILAEKGYDWSSTTSYVEDLFSLINNRLFDEAREKHKSASLINQFALHYASRPVGK